MNIEKPDFLKHYSPVYPEDMGRIIKPNYNYDMYRKEYSSRVFATSLNSASQMYFFLHCAKGYFYVDDDNVIIILKSIDQIDKVLKHQVYLYHINSIGFEPVFLNDKFCGEWVNYNEVNIENIKIDRMSFNDVITNNKFGRGLTIFCANDLEHYKNIRLTIDKMNYKFQEDYLFNHSKEYESIKQMRLIKK